MEIRRKPPLMFSRLSSNLPQSQEYLFCSEKRARPPSRQCWWCWWRHREQQCNHILRHGSAPRRMEVAKWVGAPRHRKRNKKDYYDLIEFLLFAVLRPLPLPFSQPVLWGKVLPPPQYQCWRLLRTRGLPICHFNWNLCAFREGGSHVGKQDYL